MLCKSGLGVKNVNECKSSTSESSEVELFNAILPLPPLSRNDLSGSGARRS